MFVDNSPAGAAYIVTNDKGDKVKRSAVACVLCVCVLYAIHSPCVCHDGFSNPFHVRRSTVLIPFTSSACGTALQVVLHVLVVVMLH